VEEGRTLPKIMIHERTGGWYTLMRGDLQGKVRPGSSSSGKINNAAKWVWGVLPHKTKRLGKGVLNMGGSSAGKNRINKKWL